MRITGGSLRNRKLKTPRGPLVEPVPDMVREAVFSILQHVVPGACVLDLFACSGSMGFEAISRGATEVLFVDNEPAAARVIRDNVERLGVGESAEVLLRDVMTLPPYLMQRAIRFDLAFLDPPYAMSDDPETLGLLGTLLAGLFESGVMSGEGIAVFRNRRGGGIVLEERGNFAKDIRAYGTSQVVFIERA